MIIIKIPLIFQGWSNGNIEFIPFPYICKSTHEHEMNETSFFKVQNDKIFSEKASMANSNSFIEYLLQ